MIPDLAIAAGARVFLGICGLLVVRYGSTDAARWIGIAIFHAAATSLLSLR